ncbi:MAG TPA: hypothetical protein VLZ78_05875, partial [Terrimesophilobacter sp.]|nr:hypothetical protein [Terrimesophilobacter sp.]
FEFVVVEHSGTVKVRSGQNREYFLLLEHENLQNFGKVCGVCGGVPPGTPLANILAVYSSPAPTHRR